MLNGLVFCSSFEVLEIVNGPVMYIGHLYCLFEGHIIQQRTL